MEPDANPWLADDSGRRYDAFWDWVAMHDPPRPSWQLDSIAVQPELQGRGIGKALIESRCCEGARGPNRRIPIDRHGGQRDDLPSTPLSTTSSLQPPVVR